MTLQRLRPILMWYVSHKRKREILLMRPRYFYGPFVECTIPSRLQSMPFYAFCVIAASERHMRPWLLLRCRSAQSRSTPSPCVSPCWPSTSKVGSFSVQLGRFGSLFSGYSEPLAIVFPGDLGATSKWVLAMPLFCTNSPEGTRRIWDARTRECAASMGSHVIPRGTGEFAWQAVVMGMDGTSTSRWVCIYLLFGGIPWQARSRDTRECLYFAKTILEGNG